MRADRARTLQVNVMVERAIYWTVRDFARDYDLTTSNAARILMAVGYTAVKAKGWQGTAQAVYNVLEEPLRSEWRTLVDKALDGGADRQVPWD